MVFTATIKPVELYEVGYQQVEWDCCAQRISLLVLWHRCHCLRILKRKVGSVE